MTQCGPRSSLVSHTDSYLHGIVRILPAEWIGNGVIESTLRYGRWGCIGSANPNALCHQEFNRHSRRQLLAWLGLPQRAEQWLWNLRCHPTDGACLAAIRRSTWLIWGPFATLIWASTWGGGLRYKCATAPQWRRPHTTSWQLQICSQVPCIIHQRHHVLSWSNSYLYSPNTCFNTTPEPLNYPFS